MGSNYFQNLPFETNGSIFFYIAETLPLIIWVLVFKYFYYDVGLHQQNPYTNILLVIPFIGVFYNIYLSVSTPGLTLPLKWKGCVNTKVESHEKDQGILGHYDYSCLNAHQLDNEKKASDLNARFYYVSYILFFIILLFQGNYFKLIGKRDALIKQASAKKGALVNLICISGIFGILGSMAPLFMNGNIWTLMTLKFLSSVIWMSVTLLIIVLLDMYFLTTRN